MTKKRKTQEQRRKETRSKLINATVAVINEKGYAAMRTTDITRKAGVTWGAAQHLFGSRADLMMEVSLSVSDTLADMLETDIDLTRPPAERLETIIDRTWQTYSSSPYFAMVEIIRGTRKDLKIHDRLVKAQTQISKRIRRLWLKVFDDLVESGVTTAERVEHVSSLVTLYLSGLASRKIYYLPSAQTRAHIQYLKRIAVAELVGAG